MTENNFIISTFNRDDFKDFFNEGIEDALAKFFKQLTLKEAQGEILLTRDELCEKLGISKPTLHKRMNDGSIPFIKLGSRTFFKMNDVIKSMEDNNV